MSRSHIPTVPLSEQDNSLLTCGEKQRSVTFALDNIGMWRGGGVVEEREDG